MDKDKRHSIRFKLITELAISTTKEIHFEVCELINISESGCCVLQKTLFYPDDRVTLKFSLENSYIIKGEVRWTKGKETGISFIKSNISDQTNVSQLLKELGKMKFQKN